MRGTLSIPEAHGSRDETAEAVIHAALDDLRAAAPRWGSTGLKVRAAMARQAIDDVLAVSEEWVLAACRAKQIDPRSPRAGEEWQSGPHLTIRMLRLMAETLDHLDETGNAPFGKVRRRGDGTVAVEVFPADLWDRLLFAGVRGEVWMREEVSPDSIEEHMAGVYRDPPPPKVTVVLGAGNIASIPAMDSISKMYGDNAVVMLKMNPVNDYLGPILERGLAAFVEAGFLSIVYGGAELGERLVLDERIDSIHVTGSDKTHDAIVFGQGAEGERRKAAGTPRIDKHITAELGNVSPVIVVPGPWTERDLRYQAENLASGLTHNAGFNCIANRVIVTHREWGLRNSLIDSIASKLGEIPLRHAYYPGAVDRWHEYVDTYDDLARRFGDNLPNELPWTLISVPPDDESGMCFEAECFNGIVSETSLGAESAVDYIEAAVEFCNDRLWGTLGATLIVHPESMKDAAVAAAVERAIADLRYGSVSVNIWVAVAYAAVTTTWGAHPGHTLVDIGSGRGVVHNARLFDRPLKSVVWAPFRQLPKPVWFASHKRSHRALRALTHHEADPSFTSLLKVAFHAARG